MWNAASCLPCPGYRYVRVATHLVNYTTHIIRFFTFERLSEYIRCQRGNSRRDSTNFVRRVSLIRPFMLRVKWNCAKLPSCKVKFPQFSRRKRSKQPNHVQHSNNGTNKQTYLRDTSTWRYLVLVLVPSKEEENYENTVLLISHWTTKQYWAQVSSIIRIT